MELKTIIWMFMFGVCAALFAVYYNNKFLGKIVRKLIEIDATSKDTALSSEELGIKITPFVKYAMRPGTSFSQTVLKTDDGKYYISSKKLSVAKAKYSGKDTSTVFILICVLILLLVTFVFTAIFPDVIDSFNEQLSEIFGERN